MSLPGAARWSLTRGDACEVSRRLPDGSVDAVVTDPPYGIGFHRERWDTPTPSHDTSPGEAFEAFSEAWATECLRVLKPGGHLVAFGAPRTAHRLAVGVERAGFELRDQLIWLYGTGVPKTRLHDGRASQLKPGYEPILLARKPFAGGLDANETAHGTGRLNIDAARSEPEAGAAIGRWPANVALTHGRSCTEARCGMRCAVWRLEQHRPGASRFFYCPKPARAERDRGCERLPARSVRIYGPSTPKARRNIHPTVKPVALMRWLVRLVTPEAGVVLDPFTGSGTTGIAALLEDRTFIGIEQDPAYTQIARARLRHATHDATGGGGENRM